MAKGIRLQICLVGAVSLVLATALGLRAETPAPANPLRTNAAPAMKKAASADQSPQRSVLAKGEAGIWAAAPVASIQQVQAIEPLPPPEPKSIVPPDLGQPHEPPLAIGWQPPAVLHEDWTAAEIHAGQGSWLQPWFAHTDPNDPYRQIGMGEPLIGTSWRNRPVFVGFFVGGIMTDDLIAGRVRQNNATILGGRLGWDFDHYWGIEARYAYSRTNLTDIFGAPLDDQSRNYFADLELLYYPWGDSRWRPYVGGGLGFATYRFRDEFGQRIHDSLLHIPLGVGIKYYHSNACTLRLDAFDNISVGDNTLATLHNFSLTAGVEFRFGGSSPSYFPWHGNTTIW